MRENRSALFLHRRKLPGRNLGRLDLRRMPAESTTGGSNATGAHGAKRMKSTNAKLKDWFSAWDADQIIGWMDRRKAHRKSRWIRKLNRMLDRYEEEEKRRKETP